MSALIAIAPISTGLHSERIPAIWPRSERVYLPRDFTLTSRSHFPLPALGEHLPCRRRGNAIGLILPGTVWRGRQHTVSTPGHSCGRGCSEIKVLYRIRDRLRAWRHSPLDFGYRAIRRRRRPL